MIEKKKTPTMLASIAVPWIRDIEDRKLREDERKQNIQKHCGHGAVTPGNDMNMIKISERTHINKPKTQLSIVDKLLQTRYED